MTTYRTGRKVGRTIYRQLGDEPADDDRLVGVMDSIPMAEAAVAGLNLAHQVATEQGFRHWAALDAMPSTVVSLLGAVHEFIE